jgi:hypothetical protein
MFRFFAILLALSPAAWAYVPPSQFLVKTLVTKHGGIKGVRIRSIVSGMDGEKASGAVFKETTWFDSAKRLLRSWATDEADHKLYVIERPADALTAADQLLLDSDPRAVMTMLKTHGVPVKSEEELLALPTEEDRRSAETLALARFNGGVDWVIGRRGKPEPQLWLEKDTFLPTRFLMSETDGSLEELQFGSYRFYREFPFPRSITVLGKTGAPVLRDELTDLTVSPAKLEAELKTPVQAGWTDAGNSAPAALRDLIRSYYEQLR